MKKLVKCCICEEVLNKNTIGLNKKFHGENIVNSFCMACLSAHLDISVEDLYAKIEDFKLQGCTLFE